jgi:hypothetical protein
MTPLATIALLVGTNAIPLLGVIVFDWDLLTILVLYWVENGVIGIVNVARIARAEGQDPASSTSTFVAGRATGRAAIIPFFVLHYGIFWVVHGVFVFTLPLFAGIGTRPGGAGGPALDYARFSPEGVALAAIGLAISHAGAYHYDYIGRGVFRTRSPAGQAFEPYPRLIVLHVTILLGAWIVFGLGQPVLLIALMVVLKTLFDVALYLLSRRRGG